MNESEIVLAVRQLAIDLRSHAPAAINTSDAFNLLQSIPGKGGPLIQWFNRESNQERKRIISDILGHVARASYQQKSEAEKLASDKLEELCDRLEKIDLSQ